MIREMKEEDLQQCGVIYAKAFPIEYWGIDWNLDNAKEYLLDYEQKRFVGYSLVMEHRKRICFQYRNVGAGFDEILRHGGKWYDVSCYRIQVDGNRIYMYVGDAEAKKAKTFRLEHLYRVFVSKEPMESPKLYYGNDPEKEIQRRVNESVFHFDGEPVRLRIIVQYEPFIMEMLLNLSHGRIQKMEDPEDGSKYVWFDTRRSEPLCRY